MEEKDYWLGFSVCRGIGPARFALLIKYFGSAKNAWEAPLEELVASGIGKTIAEDLISFRKIFRIEHYLERLHKVKVSFVTLEEAGYPILLKEIHNPPFVLFYKGVFDFNTPENMKTIAVVGTRKITSYGVQVTELLTQGLVAYGFRIVSGLALGVDSMAHKTTIASGGKTIAVLGCGIDQCYPAESIALHSSILQGGNGVVVSEYPLGVRPTKGSFVARNRIIAGLSLGVVVTEGAEDSGSLITAKVGVENNRQVFAVPGQITSSLSKGPIVLIANGAKMVTSVDDIVKELGIPTLSKLREASESIKSDNLEEQKILDLLKIEPKHFDEIVRETGFVSSQIGTLLSLMEMKGMVRSLDSGAFALVL